jgi:hypothetical protein
MNTTEAIKYLKMVSDSFDPNTAPRFSKEEIEQERDKAREAIVKAITNLERGE